MAWKLIAAASQRILTANHGTRGTINQDCAHRWMQKPARLNMMLLSHLPSSADGGFGVKKIYDNQRITISGDEGQDGKGIRRGGVKSADRERRAGLSPILRRPDSRRKKQHHHHANWPQVSETGVGEVAGYRSGVRQKPASGGIQDD